MSTPVRFPAAPRTIFSFTRSSSGDSVSYTSAENEAMSFIVSHISPPT